VIRIATLAGISLALAGCGGPDEASEGALGDAPDQEQWLAENVGTATSAVTVCPARVDARGEVTVFDGLWGGYPTCTAFCPANSFAYRINIASLAPQGGCASGDLCLNMDDVGATAVSLHCFDRNTGAFTGYATSTQGSMGSWLDTLSSPTESRNNPIVSGNLRFESGQGTGDDTAANGIKVSFANVNGEHQAPFNTPWGTFRGKKSCPEGQAVCGLRTRVEASVDGVAGGDSGNCGGIHIGDAECGFDDSQLNGVRFQCCQTCSVGKEMCWDSVCRNVGTCPPIPPPR
jgi:hypothetical protein